MKPISNTGSVSPCGLLIISEGGCSERLNSFGSFELFLFSIEYEVSSFKSDENCHT